MTRRLYDNSLKNIIFRERGRVGAREEEKQRVVASRVPAGQLINVIDKYLAVYSMKTLTSYIVTLCCYCFPRVQQYVSFLKCFG